MSAGDDVRRLAKEASFLAAVEVIASRLDAADAHDATMREAVEKVTDAMVRLAETMASGEQHAREMRNGLLSISEEQGQRIRALEEQVAGRRHQRVPGG